MIKNLFPTPVKFSNLTLSTALLQQEVKELFSLGYDSDLKSGVNGTRLDITNKLLEEKKPQTIIKLLTHIQQEVYNYCKEVNIKPQYITQSWINVNPTNSINVRHSHPGSVLSGAYYVKYPTDANSPLSFYRSREFSDYGWSSMSLDQNIELQSIFKYFPVDNDLVIFPSFVEHDVLPNQSNEDRISLSFNTSP